MATELECQGKPDDWTRKAADRAADQYALSVENGMFPLEAESEAKRNHMFLPSQEDESELGVDPNRLTDPAREGGCPPTELELPGAIRRITVSRKTLTIA